MAQSTPVLYEPPTEIYDIVLSKEFKTADIDDNFEKSFARMQHLSYTFGLDVHSADQIYFHATDYLKMSSIYWGLMAITLCGGLDIAKQQQGKALTQFVLDCYDPQSGGFRGNIDHVPHLLYTLSALQILTLLDGMDILTIEQRQHIKLYITSLQRPNGSFIGDPWGEVDTRFSYCAVNSLILLGETPTTLSQCINLNNAIDYVFTCSNFDGGFGAVSNAESHAAQIFCVLAFLSLTGAIPYQYFNNDNDNNNTVPSTPDPRLQPEVLAWWLCERQLPCGGLNGRPEKKEDVCYSWWVLTSLAMLNHTDWVNKDKLTTFILNCQDMLYGGISDRSDNMTDIFHTYFGIAGLSLLNAPGLEQIEPVMALPTFLVQRLSDKSKK